MITLAFDHTHLDCNGALEPGAVIYTLEGALRTGADIPPFGPPQVVRLVGPASVAVELPVPQPGPGEVAMVRYEWCDEAGNCGGCE